ncbi:hypothetical protein LTR66_014334, partial [Elasticomyces elasticus]
MANKSPAPRAGLSLYANLLDPSRSTGAGSTISSAPVTYTRPTESSLEDDNAKKQATLAASLRFQPMKRPQQKSALDAQKAKAKAIAAKLSGLPQLRKGDGQPEVAVPKDDNTAPPPTDQQDTSTTQAFRSTADDWKASALSDDETNFFAASARKQGQQSRKKRKKNKGQEKQAFEVNWDDIYDPSRPNSYEEYKGSEEKVREVREWKDLLYKHRMKRSGSGSRDGHDEEMDVDVPRNSTYHPFRNLAYTLMLAEQFAPPPVMSFAPPSFDDAPPPPPEDKDEDDYAPLPAAKVPNDISGDDVYARRMAMSNQQALALPPPPPQQAQIQPPAPPEGSIMRAPVRYNISLPQADSMPADNEDDSEPMQEDTSALPVSEPTEAPRTNRPGQKGFAERLLAKYGWEKSQGLGASGTGITNALYAKADKRKKKSDQEGGGFVTPATTGKILGGHKSKPAQQEEKGKFGAMSEVIRLEGMLKGLDVATELARGDGGLMQEIGEECAEKYGNVERVYIHTGPGGDGDSGALVFVLFTAQLSALRAVNALEGRIFNGNDIRVTFWDKERFES